MDSEKSTDRAWVERVLQGDTDAGDALVERLLPLVSRIVRGRVTDRTEAADLTQMVFLKTFAKLDQFPGGVPLEHWVSRIAVTVCLKEYRRERTRPEVRRADLSPEQDEMLDELVGSAEVAPEKRVMADDLVSRLLAGLSPKERLIMSLLYLEGRTPEETGQWTGMSNLAVRLVAFRARRKMKKALHTLQKERRL